MSLYDHAFMTEINPDRIAYCERNLRHFDDESKKELIIDWVLSDCEFLTYAEAHFLIASLGLKEV